jgi:cysteine desulfurase/selenocysteine lyase
MPGRLVYLDNAAATWPNPPQVAAAMARFLTEVGANPGRSGHQASLEAARVVYRAREAVAGLLGLSDPLRVIFTANATHALNLAINGVLRPGDHVVTTSMEHNSVMRPLRALEAEGTGLTVVPCAADGVLDVAAIERALLPETAMIVMNHASNVVGTLLPVPEVAAIAHAHNVLLLVDAAQSAGALPIDMDELGIDLLAFTGHKALLGPTGTGGLLISERVDASRLRPLMRGGTGSDSETEAQPDFLPDRLESGTLNAVGLAGLEAAIGWLVEQGVEALRTREHDLTARLIEGLRQVPKVRVYGALDADRQLGVVSFNVDGADPAVVDLRLNEDFGISARVGLQCAPAAHKTIGTFPQGTVRFSLGPFTSADDIDYAIGAVCAVAGETTA